MKNTILAHAALMLLNILYGANHLLAKGVMPAHLSSNAFIFLRVSVTTVFFVFLYFIFVREKVKRQDIFLLAICGFFGVALNQLFFFSGLELTSAMNAGIIMTSTPIIVVVMAYFILKEPITKLKVIGILLGAIGAVQLITLGRIPSFDSPLGDLYILINAASFSLYLVLVKPLMSKYKPMTVITFNFIFGSIFVLLYPPVLTDVFQTNFFVIPSNVWWKIGFVVFGATCLTYLLNIFALKHVSPSVSGSYIYTQPILVIIFTILFAKIGWSDDYSKSITGEKIIYMLLIFSGVYLISLSAYRLKKKNKMRVKD